MEKKKLLLVAVSVGVFLVIVVSAAILIFRPGASAGPEISYRQINAESEQLNRSATTDPANMVKDDTYMGLQDPAAGSPIQKNYITSEPLGTLTEESADNDTQRVINIPRPSAPAVPSAPARPAVSSRVSSPPAAGAPVKPQTPVQTTVKPAVTAPVSKQQYRDFWVQAGSFSTRERADGVKHTLDDKGISAIVTNQEINGNTYYRVRVGPYTSQNEADYWLAMIKSIDGFQDSQVWESQSLR